jgi:RNA polymerase II subunit A small phosphatase-like protein
MWNAKLFSILPATAGVDEFLRVVGEHYEVIVYTASLSKYADPLLDELDVSKVISSRLFRENCVFYDGKFISEIL